MRLTVLILVIIHCVYVEAALCVLLRIMLEGRSLIGIFINFVVSLCIYLHPANCICFILTL